MGKTLSSWVKFCLSCFGYSNMDIKALLKESVLGETLDDETDTICVLIPKDIFNHIIHLIPRDEEED